MNDWRKKIQEYHARIAEEDSRKANEEKHLHEISSATSHNIWLKNWQKKFHCHICGKGSEREVKVNMAPWPDPPDMVGKGIPEDLEKCEHCSRWTCAEHIHMGICQTCGEKL